MRRDDANAEAVGLVQLMSAMLGDSRFGPELLIERRREEGLRKGAAT
jgi:hypothetical protein